MDYCEWGMEYLRQAQRLKEYLKPLREQLKKVSGPEYIMLYRRVSMLNEMRLELYHTGNDLLNKGARG
ncbi:MAG: Diguanylate cyclase [Oscillospiraceae bacterium]|jgi:hypothetical protein